MGPLVLLVEDDPDARIIYRSCLNHASFDVVEAPSARDAIEAAAARKPDIVVLDRRLPDRDGLELARLWRAGGPMAKVPIIVLTAFTTRSDVEASLEAGCDAFLAKPCAGDIVAAHVSKLLIASAPTRKLPRYAK